MPERKISTLNAPAKNDSEMISPRDVGDERRARRRSSAGCRGRNRRSRAGRAAACCGRPGCTSGRACARRAGASRCSHAPAMPITHAKHDADDRQLDRHPEAAREAAAIERVVEDREIDAGGVVQPPEPVPDELHRPSPSAARNPGTADDGCDRQAGTAARYLYFDVHVLRELRRLDAVLLLELLDEAGLVPVGDGLGHEVAEGLLALS